ncbi:MAG TPA: hypothetical protein VMZ91_15935 [Candidatus Paceibacterota bacterium]|nr:hypothetical protein [Candidatus Paceibacterota bacterium]
MPKKEYTKKDIEDIVKDSLKGKDFEKAVKEITSKVITDLYRSFWVKRQFWQKEIE